jgi:ribonuclease T2
MRSVAVVLAVALVVLLSAQGSEAQGPTKDFMFLFVQGWPGTICKDWGCQNLPSTTHPGAGFLIHGLWAQYYDHGWPQNCDPSNVFSESEVSDLLPDMNVRWPSIMGEMDGDDFWTHEWSRHGTCATSVFPTQHDFFSATLSLRDKYDVEGILSASGITPGGTYNTRDVSDAVVATTGYAPAITCKNSDLWEIWICLDKSLSPVECPQSTVIPTPCGSTVNYPADPFPRNNNRYPHAAAAAPAGMVSQMSLFAVAAACGLVGILVGAVIAIVVYRRRNAASAATQEPLLSSV